MPPLDAGLFTPISDDHPAGDDLELDPEFGELERAAQGKPEVQYGNTIEPAEPPDWKQTALVAESLLTRTHDLRVMVYLAMARLNLGGLPPFAEIMAAIRQELLTRWADVHPRLDPDDDNDPMQRANALLRLGDPLRVLRPLRDLTIAKAPRTGAVAWRDIAIVNGTQPPEGDRPVLTESIVLGAFRDGDRAFVTANRDALARLLIDAPGIVDAFEAQTRLGKGPNLTPLVELLTDMHRDVARYQSMAGPSEGETDAAEAAPETAPGAAVGTVGVAGAPTRSFASIQAITALTRREDAMHALELASAYFRTQEPSSPLPLLIDRAKRLSGMAFMEILRDLAPDGVSQAQLVAGATNE